MSEDKVTELANSLAAFPGVRKVVAERATLKGLLLRNDGQYFLSGKMWRIASKKAGPGVYYVWLDEPE